MLDKLEQIEARYEALTDELSQPEVYSDPANYAKLNKQHRSLGEIVTKYREWKQIKSDLAGAKELFDLEEDEEMRELARVEVDSLTERLGRAEEELRVLLLPRDPNDEKNVILEIRAGTGGDEATLFAAEMLRMYGRYAERQGWKMEILDQSESGIGGLKEAVASACRRPSSLRGVAVWPPKRRSALPCDWPCRTRRTRVVSMSSTREP